MKFYYKIHKTQYGNLIAISDEELLGKTIKNKNLDFTVSERFYGSELTDESVINFLDTCNDGNIIGNNIVNLFLKLEIIDKKSVVRIGNQKHAQFSILN